MTIKKDIQYLSGYWSTYGIHRAKNSQFAAVTLLMKLRLIAIKPKNQRLKKKKYKSEK
jgi:hypothetical protein